MPHSTKDPRPCETPFGACGSCATSWDHANRWRPRRCTEAVVARRAPVNSVQTERLVGLSPSRRCRPAAPGPGHGLPPRVQARACRRLLEATGHRSRRPALPIVSARSCPSVRPSGPWSRMSARAGCATQRGRGRRCPGAPIPCTRQRGACRVAPSRSGASWASS